MKASGISYAVDCSPKLFRGKMNEGRFVHA